MNTDYGSSTCDCDAQAFSSTDPQLRVTEIKPKEGYKIARGHLNQPRHHSRESSGFELRPCSFYRSVESSSSPVAKELHTRVSCSPHSRSPEPSLASGKSVFLSVMLNLRPPPDGWGV